MDETYRHEMPEHHEILRRALQIENNLVSWRREFHAHPELGFKETQTARRVAEVLESLGYRVRSQVGKTGVVGELGDGGPLVGIRADMDALPLQEENDTPYASQVSGVMHACGHDSHTAMALGAARLLAQEPLPGRVRFLFQPSEEVEDEEGISGAPRMVEDGAMEGVDAVFALHVDPADPVGTIRVGDGPSSAGVDTFYATVIGRGGHGAAPHKVVDPIHITGYVILALHTIVSRRLHPTKPAVISIGSIHGGQADNVIPERVEMSGTIRYMAKDIQKQIHQEIERAMEVARAMGGDYELRIDVGYPPMYNDTAMAELVKEAAGAIIGADQILPPREEMGAEDFGFFSALAPGVMFTLGSRIEGDERKAHSPHFDIDERCLPIGSAILAQSALTYLKKRHPSST